MSYDPTIGRWLSEDPIGFEAGDANKYRYVENEVTTSIDPDGLTKKKVIGWVVRRVGNQLIKVSAVYTERQAARMFLGKCATHGLDLLLRDGGRKGATKVARIIEGWVGKDATGKLLQGGTHLGHPIRNRLGEVIGVGTRHIQFDKINGRHIFYSTLAWALYQTGQADAADGDYSLDVTEVYKDHYPGSGELPALTFTYWCGEDSWGRHLDWVNPGELISLASEVGRSLDRETWKELIGYSITIRDQNGEPINTITIGPNGEPISQTPWTGGVPGEPVPLSPLEDND